jgi:hypothetical protein
VYSGWYFVTFSVCLLPCTEAIVLAFHSRLVVLGHMITMERDRKHGMLPDANLERRRVYSNFTVGEMHQAGQSSRERDIKRRETGGICNQEIELGSIYINETMRIYHKSFETKVYGHRW